MFALLSFGSSYNNATLSMGSAWAVCIPTSKSPSFKSDEACRELFNNGHIGMGIPLGEKSSIEDELREEIRALKGLVLIN